MQTPASGTTAYLVLRAQKNGETLFEDTGSFALQLAPRFTTKQLTP